MGSVSGLRGKRVYLNANIFIYAVEQVEPYIEILTALFKAIEAREIDAFTCGLSLTETISKPIQTQNLKSKEAYIKAITGSPHLISPRCRIADCFTAGAHRLPSHHVTVRVPWHDGGWTGSVCARPLDNPSSQPRY